ncbi:hypothetical protein [Avibacterium endocarditidis]|nr:hypothetical protein [Avibacterium endocarditidis]
MKLNVMSLKIDKNFDKVKQDFEKEKDKIRKLQEHIEVFKKKITALQASTRNEKILVRKVIKNWLHMLLLNLFIKKMAMNIRSNVY